MKMSKIIPGIVIMGILSLLFAFQMPMMFAVLIEGGGGNPPGLSKQFEYDSNYGYWYRYPGHYTSSSSSEDNIVVGYTTRVDGVTDSYGHFNRIDRLVINIESSVNFDDNPDYVYDGPYTYLYAEEWSYKIDSIKVSVKIKNPQGYYLNHRDVANAQQKYHTKGASGTPDVSMSYLYTSIVNYFGSQIPWPYKLIFSNLQYLTSLSPSSPTTYTDGSSGSYTHWWKFDYGYRLGDDELGLQIRSTPSMGSLSGTYKVWITYEIRVNKIGWYADFTGPIPWPISFEEYAFTKSFTEYFTLTR